MIKGPTGLSEEPLKALSFPQPFHHAHAPIRSVNEILAEESTLGQQAADWTTSIMGSWWFIGVQSLVLIAWVIFNVTAWTRHWDPYPFILMNLVMSLQAAYTAPIIMMSQNRQTMRDRLEAHNDYQINQKAEQEIRAILDHLAAQDQALAQMHELLLALQSQGGERSGTQ